MNQQSIKIASGMYTVKVSCFSGTNLNLIQEVKVWVKKTLNQCKLFSNLSIVLQYLFTLICYPRNFTNYGILSLKLPLRTQLFSCNMLNETSNQSREIEMVLSPMIDKRLLTLYALTFSVCQRSLVTFSRRYLSLLILSK